MPQSAGKVRTLGRLLASKIGEKDAAGLAMCTNQQACWLQAREPATSHCHSRCGAASDEAIYQIVEYVHVAHLLESCDIIRHMATAH